MRVHLKGVASATKRLADGRKVTYYYAWRGGPKLEGECYISIVGGSDLDNLNR